MKAAAEKGHQKAQLNLGRMLLSGRGASLDVAQARLWLQKAAAQGNEDAVKLLTEIAAQHSSQQARSDTKAGQSAKQTTSARSSVAAQRNLEDAAKEWPACDLGCRMAGLSVSGVSGNQIALGMDIVMPDDVFGIKGVSPW